MQIRKLTKCLPLAASMLGVLAMTAPVTAQSSGLDKAAIEKAAGHKPWMNTSLSPDQRADLVMKEMTQDEKLKLVHGTGWGVLKEGTPVPERSNYGAGFAEGIPRLGIPDINEADSAVGARMAALESRYATLLPSTLGAASSWNPESAQLYGSVIGRELRAQGFNMSIGGGVDLLREPRNGRNWEYAGEDPLLAGTMTGNLMKGMASQQVMSDIKHYAMNDQESGREILNVVATKKAMRESDLLAFQIAIGIAKPSAVMCSYNKVNGDWACENDYLLNQVLKKDFNFKGFVVSDWEATHSTVKAVMAGLDQEMPGDKYLGDPLKKAIADGKVPQSRLDDMAHRVLRSMFAAGVVDNPTFPRSVVDPFRGLEDAQAIAEQSIVLLKNANNILPLGPGIKTIALIGSRADTSVLSGGGSAQVDAPGGAPGGSKWGTPVYFPSSPLKYISKHAPNAKVVYNDGKNASVAATFAQGADIAIVFVNQWQSEAHDSAKLSLPDGQDGLVKAVAAANPHTIVVLENGSPVSMPWADEVSGIVEAWYPGIGGAQALSNILFGDVNPTGKLPATFARTEADLPHPEVPGIHHMIEGKWPPFDVKYPEGAKVGYKWFEAEHKQPLFPFGFGLSYTTYAYSDLTTDSAQKTATFTVKNTGSRAGTEIAQVYASLPAAAGESYKRLIGWQRVTLNPGESKTVTVTADPLLLSVFNEQKDGWDLLPGEYTVVAGPSSAETPLKASFHIQ